MTKHITKEGRAPELTTTQDVATIRFQRPGEHNRIDPGDIPVLRGFLSRIESQEEMRLVVFTGAGEETFSSGYTIEAILDRLDRSFEDLLDAIEAFPLPTLCALNGSIYGGATDLALCCDFRIGVLGSRMFMPAARFGLHYYPGGLRRYVSVVGVAQAKRIFLTAQALDAEEMLRIGFLTELLDRSHLQSRVDAYASALRDCEPRVVRSMKRQLRAIAARDEDVAASREDYESSLASTALKERLAAVTAKQ